MLPEGGRARGDATKYRSARGAVPPPTGEPMVPKPWRSRPSAIAALLLHLLAGAALGVQPSPARAADLRTAVALLDKGQVASARAELNAVLAERPNDIEANELAIDLRVSAGEAEAVLKEYRDRSAAQPDNADAAYLLGRAEPAPDAARAAFELALRLSPEHARAWMGIGALERVGGRPGAAVAAYERALKADPRLIEAWNGLRKATLALEDMRGAQAVSRRALDALPEERDTWLALAAFVPVEAPKLLAEAAARFPDDPVVQIAYGRALFENGLTQDALAVYEALLNRWPDRTLRTEAALLADIRAERLDLQGAKAILESRERLGPDPKAAERALSDAARRWPRSATLQLVWGNVLAATGQPVEAEKALRRAVELDPDSPEINSGLGMFLLATKRPDAALPSLDRAAAARPEEVALGVAAGMARAEAGDPAGAAERLLNLTEAHPYEVAPPLALARVLMSARAAPQAIAVLIDALVRRPDPELFRALLVVARAAGQLEAAAAQLESEAKRTGDPRFTDGAAMLRAAASPP